jgi:hypothetical protein
MSVVKSTITERHTVILQRAFAVSGGITDPIILAVLRELREEKATGKVTINLSEGYIGSIQFEESAKI